MRSGEVVGSSGPAASGAARESVLVGARRRKSLGVPPRRRKCSRSLAAPLAHGSDQPRPGRRHAWAEFLRASQRDSA